MHEILNNLGIEFEEPHNIPGARFRLLNTNLPENTYLNIPQNVNFTFQILFEGPNQIDSRNILFNELVNLNLPVFINPNQLGTNYSTIYLNNPPNQGIVIAGNELQIAEIIAFWYNYFQ